MNAVREQARVRGLVLGVIERALVDRDLSGVVLGGAPCPEASLLREWCTGRIPVETPSADRVSRVAASLRGEAGAPEDHSPETSASHGGEPAGAEAAVAEAWDAAARHLARVRPLLIVHPANKLQLLLEPRWAPCFPLGDVWPSELRSWGLTPSWPAVMAHHSDESRSAAEAALRKGLDGGVGLRTALSELREARGPGGVDFVNALARRLAHSRPTGRPPLIPKITAWTLGMELGH